jgi:hypothetical protein
MISQESAREARELTDFHNELQSFDQRTEVYGPYRVRRLHGIKRAVEFAIETFFNLHAQLRPAYERILQTRMLRARRDEQVVMQSDEEETSDDSDSNDEDET